MVQREILDAVASDRLKVFVVWTPVLREDGRQEALKSTEFVSDQRAKHFWDEDKSLGMVLGKTVRLPRGRTLAWDVYFIFDRTAKWGEQAPVPHEWMHQLGTDDRTLDGSTLREKVKKVLATGE